MTQKRDTTSERGPGTQPVSIRPGRLRWLRRALRPLRRITAWFALVGEEQEIRRGSDQSIEVWVRDVEKWGREDRQRFESHVSALTGELRALRTEIEALQRTIDSGIGARADHTLKELWLRLESADAHQATAIQRLADEVARLVDENAAIFRALDSLRPLEGAELSVRDAENE
jgi:hypothetical protein